ncbi:WD domain G-beta repeat [Carpediemonas membranifera]|uniref:Arp2/3 complex 41 kDa subunit n=1 Tax=Carpediemonas membranifera TaxID=201153 RepID=A0A8J6B6U5_9EUKA|nr:WD domain G-beta repeat [Carpediemonas membranifera]|eukprot:KAG9395494.1 WD domain G-beta repeat [Carpediemonas membranifera]
MQTNKLAEHISAHAWNADHTQVAICPNNNEIVIFEMTEKGPVEKHKLLKHDQHVSAIDWCHETNNIVSCSHDRSAYVWTFADGVWSPELVILPINRAALSVAWSPNGTKFVVTSGQHCVCICHRDTRSTEWWVSRRTDHPSMAESVTAAAWHPNGIVCACGGMNGKVLLFAAVMKGVDKRPTEAVYGFGPPIRFPQPLIELDVTDGAWIQDIAFSPSGDELMIVTGDAKVRFVTLSADQPCPVATVTLTSEAMLAAVYINETAAIATGYNAEPLLFTKDAEGWAMRKSLDPKKGNAEIGGGPKKPRSAAFAKFEAAAASSGKAESAMKSKGVQTVHRNTVPSIRLVDGGVVSTAGLDGVLVQWKLGEGEVAELIKAM